MSARARFRQRLARSLGRALLSRREYARLSGIEVRDAGHGYDAFGMHRDWLIAATGLGGPLYRRYFRVTAHGTEALEWSGPAILIANHAGTLPIDAALLSLDVLVHSDPPRMPRCIVDHFVPELPFVGTLFSRLGTVSGTQNNLRHLVEAKELCLIFPEGLAAIGKPFSRRYQLQSWRVGHAEAALRYGTPVIPVAIIGSEEQWPQIGRIAGFRAFGAPYLPIPLTPLPLPVHYHIHYGAPIDLRAEVGAELDTETIARAAALTQRAVERLIASGLAARRGVFR